MNRILGIVTACIVFTALSCSNDFDLIEGQVDIPIVYGLLNPLDSAHYIRVEKAFVDEEIAPTVLAQDPANLYYDNVEVKLSRGSESFTLRRVDANLEGYKRDSGAFVNAPNYLYKITQEEIKLKKGDLITLRITIPNETSIRANTTIIEESSSSLPSSSTAIIDFPSDKKLEVRWKNGNGGVISSGSFRIRVKEFTPNGAVDKVINWSVFQNESKERFAIEGNAFYSILANQLTPDPLTTRFIVGVDYTLTTGDVQIDNYLKVAQANLGITSSGEIPNYTNLSRGRGIFASRSVVKIKNLAVSSKTAEELMLNPLTASLNFN